MAGNSVSIFPIMMVGMMFFRPVQTLLSYRDGKNGSGDFKHGKQSKPVINIYYFFAVFQKLQGDQAIFQKAIFVLANLVGIGLAIYKFNSMGVLPTHQSDWLEFLEPQKVYTQLKILETKVHIFIFSFTEFGDLWRRDSTEITDTVIYVYLILSITI